MRNIWSVGLVAVAVGLSGCGGDDGDSVDGKDLTSTQDVAAQIPGCTSSKETDAPELTAPDLVDDALACKYKDQRVVIEVYTTDDGFDQILDRVAIDAVKGMGFVHAGRWSVRAPLDTVDKLKDDMHVNAEVFKPKRP